MNLNLKKSVFYFIYLIFLSSCTFIKKAPKSKAYITKNTIEVKGGNFTRSEKTAVIQRLKNQLDDSSLVNTKTTFFFFTTIIEPPAFDTGFAAVSADNMKASMFHLGYYDAKVNFDADTSKRQVHVHYSVEAGKPTLIDTVSYRLRRPDLQLMTLSSLNKSVLKENQPITKAAVLGEISRLIDTFRNNGYYKFTAAELKMRGDTTIEALTTVSDDPFEQLRLLAEAQQQRDSPKIRLALVLNPPADSSRLTKYFINRVIVLPDYYPGDLWNDTTVTEIRNPGFTVRYRQNLFKPSFLGRNLRLKDGDLYRQQDYFNTINNFSRAGVWRSVNARLWELPNDSNKVNLILELMPARKFTAEASVEASYSATSNTNNALGGNLFGISLNLGLTNRNFAREAIRWAHNVRTGIELNNNSRSDVKRLVNSQEVSYGSHLTFPRIILPGVLHKFAKKNKIFNTESFINANIGYNNRLDLFNTQAVNLNFGWNFSNRQNWKWTVRPFNIEFNYLFNQTDSFRRILDSIPFLRYSYNTAFIAGMSAGFIHTYYYPKHLHSLSRERVWKVNLESTFPLGYVPILTNYNKKYLKLDLENKYTVTYTKTAVAFRGQLGLGIPLSQDSIPFFKQYAGGGSNSMRAWPIRGIGPGSQKLVPFGINIFNNRTADIQLEGNAEYRYEIARIIPNTLTLKGAFFVDIGNIWNFPNSRTNNENDNTQFRFKNLYREIGVAAGTGFRVDLNYFIVRLDLGFRIKRPETSDVNNGWKIPDIGFDDLFPKLFGRSDKYRRWRYENFNFTVGISYPF